MNKNAENALHAVNFLRRIRKDGPWTLASIDPDSGRITVHGFRLTELETMQSWIETRMGKENLYFIPNPTRRRMAKKPREADIAYYEFAHIDCDPLDAESPEDAYKRHRRALQAHNPPPSIMYSSGNGVVGLWRVNPPIKLESERVVEACKAINKAIAGALGGKEKGYDHCHSLDHLLRLPHTLNLPDARKQAKGRTPVMAGKISEYPRREYADFELPIGSPAIAPSSDREIGPAEPVEALDELNLPDHVKRLIEYGDTEGKYPSRSEADFAAIIGMMRAGVPDEKNLGVLTDDRWPVGERLHERNDPEDAARKEILRARKKLGEPEFPPLEDPAPEKKSDPARLRALKLSTVMSQPDPKWLIQDILTENALFEIFGQFKAGKTFYGIELALCIATGLDFFDTKTTQGRVIYVIAEGNAKLFGYRVKQWITERCNGNSETCKRLARDVEANFEILPLAVHMDVPTEVQGFIRANPGPRAAIFVDTLMRNMTGDPLKPQDMMRFMGGCDAIRNATGAAVVFLHHMKRENGTGGFGSIVGEAFVDGAAIVTRKGEQRIFKLKLMRDGDDTLPAWTGHLEPRDILVSMSEDGEVVRKSAVLVHDGRAGGEPLQKLLAHIHLTSPASVEALKASFGGAGRTLERNISKLRELGYVSKKGLKLTTVGLEAVPGEMDDDDDFG
jgi:AAA domain